MDATVADRPLERVVYDLATYRDELGIMQAELTRRQAAFTSANNVLIDNIRRHKDRIADCETIIRTATYTADAPVEQLIAGCEAE